MNNSAESTGKIDDIDSSSTESARYSFPSGKSDFSIDTVHIEETPCDDMDYLSSMPTPRYNGPPPPIPEQPYPITGSKHHQYRNVPMHQQRPMSHRHHHILQPRLSRPSQQWRHQTPRLSPLVTLCNGCSQQSSRSNSLSVRVKSSRQRS